MNKAIQVISMIQSKILDPKFIDQHRKDPSAFTRNRRLSFGTVVSTILQLAKRSLQIECNLIGERQMTEPVSKQAFSKARYKISHTGFKALNDQLLETVYQDNQEGLWQGYRLLGMDGSVIRLPESDGTEEFFGRHNSGGLNKGKDPILARVSEVVDLTMGIIVNAQIGPTAIGERTIGKGQIKSTVELFHGLHQENLLFVFDRGYVSKEWIDMILSLGADFLFRVPRKFNLTIDALSVKGECDTLIEPWPGKPTLRLIVRTLPSDEQCVLLTSLINKQDVSTNSLMRVYWRRWSGCEEGYKKQKIALELENFVGTGVEAVLQEFWATVLTVNLFLVHCLEEEGAWNIENPPTTRINRSVVFGSLREAVFNTAMGELSATEFWEKFVNIARRSTVKVRPGRHHPRHGLKKEKHVFRRVC